ncbi:MAG: hypothetical protein LBC91_03770 [Candidatus Accumulibacter sp.]|nr:hypothetical protein [Accumulibacter sp.]
MVITASRALRRDDLMLAALYFAQGLPTGLVALGLPPWLRAHDVGLEAIGALGLAGLPWALKFLWAPQVERLCMRRGVHPIIVATQTASALAFAALATVAMDAVAVLPAGIALLIVLNALCATQDIATDRYAILQRGAAGAARVNTARYVGFTLGMFAGGSGLLFAGGRWGWAVFMTACALWMLGQALAVRALREPAAGTGSAEHVVPRAEHVGASLRAFFAKPRAWRLLGIALVFNTAYASSEAMLKSFYVDQGMSLDAIGLVSTLNLGLLGLVGAPLGTWLLARPGVDTRGVAVVSGVAAAALLALLSLAVGLKAPIWLTIALPAAQAVVEGAASLAFLSLFMRWSVGHQPGTDFTLFLCAHGLGGMLVASFAGIVAASLGYALHFVLGAACAALAMLYAWRTAGRSPTDETPAVLQHQET